MTLIMPFECKCSVCGATNEYTELVSTNTIGRGPDLDLRPGGMQRDTMSVWIQECPECGYISNRVTDPSRVTKRWLKSKKYLTYNGISFKSVLAGKFYRYYLISMKNKNREDAFSALLRTAWACDDKNDDVNAKKCRELAIPLATKLIKSDCANKENIQLIRADLMRRAGQFDELIAKYASVRFDEDYKNQILEFQIEKAKAGDTACYCVDDVVF